MLDAQQDVFRVHAGRPGQHDRELIAAQAGHRVDGSKALTQRSREVPQYRVSGGVAMGVVDPFEVIQIDHRAGDHRRGAITGQITGASESSAVEQCRQIVMVKSPLRFCKRQLQLDDAVRELGAATTAKQGWQHGLEAGGVGEPSP
ncbi:hypothetical protein NFX52_19035 [Acidovorax facilis]|nr:MULTISPECIES: hypothetical protein [Acidovorax]KQB60501.1 hypothetical protein AE621_04680 [Acidovorax sp. SD340]MCO4243569.1 hypothetical protein [Acidovorax facilis]